MQDFCILVRLIYRNNFWKYDGKERMMNTKDFDKIIVPITNINKKWSVREIHTPFF